MTKTLKSAQQVAEIRAENISVCFNMVAALKAAEATPVTTRASGKLSQLSHNILEVFNQMCTRNCCKSSG